MPAVASACVGAAVRAETYGQTVECVCVCVPETKHNDGVVGNVAVVFLRGVRAWRHMLALDLVRCE